MRLSVKIPLMGTVLILLACISGQGVLATRQLAEVNATAQQLSATWIPRVRTLGGIKDLTERLHAGTLDRGLPTSPARDVPFDLKLKDQIDGRFETYTTLTGSSEGQNPLQAYLPLWRAYTDARMSGHAAELRGDSESAQALARTAEVAFDAARAQLDRIIAIDAQGAMESVDRVDEVSALNISTMTLSTALALLFGGGAALVLTLGVACPLARLNRAMERLSAGALDGEIPELTTLSELGGIARALATLRESLLQARWWCEEQAEKEVYMAAQRASAPLSSPGVVETHMDAPADRAASCEPREVRRPTANAMDIPLRTMPEASQIAGKAGAGDASAGRTGAAPGAVQDLSSALFGTQGPGRMAGRTTFVPRAA